MGVRLHIEQGKAVLANLAAVTKVVNEKLQEHADKIKEAEKKAADKQQRTENRSREALILRYRRVRDPIKKVQKKTKKRMLPGAQRQRMCMGFPELR